MKETLIQSIKSLAKLGLAGGVIFGVGFAMVTQDPKTTEVGPAPARADIADFMGAPSSKAAHFTEAMVAMGLQPRVYDFNGNVMYFAIGGSDKKPRELMYDIQEHLVDYGINKENHALKGSMVDASEQIDWQNLGALKDIDRPEFKPMIDRSEKLIQQGDVIPTRVTEDRVEMVGYVNARDTEDLTKIFEGDESRRPVANLMGGYRYIDAMWDGKSTEISAVWSAEDFSADRMDGIGDDQSPPDPAVPSCMGCDRDFRVQTIDGKDPFASNMFTTGLAVDETYEYYRATMQDRGWYEPGAQGFLSRMLPHLPELQRVYDMGRVMSFERGDEAMQITVMPSEMGGTTVMTTHESRDAQIAHPDKQQ